MARPFLSKIDYFIPRVDFSNYKKAVFILHDQLNFSVWPNWVSAEEKEAIRESTEKLLASLKRG